MRKSLPFWLMAMFAIFCSTSGAAQQFSALIDADQDPLTGCSLATADGTAVGIEWRVTATVSGDPPQVSAVERAQCVNGSFAAPIAMAAGYPVGLNNGVNGADVVEFAAALAELTGISRDVNIYFLAESAGGADLLGPLPLVIGSITSGPVVTEPAIIPTMHWLGLTIIFFAVLLLARRHRALRGTAAVLMLMGAGLVWAANFIPDGQVGDWATETPLATSPAPSSSNGESDIDIVAVWAADEAGRLFFRVDVAELEGPGNAAPVAQPQAVTTAVDTDVTVALVCTDADSDTLSFAISVAPANGSLGAITPLSASSASVIYTPGAGYSGPDSFQFTCDDGTVTSAPATVTITVSAAPNEPPFFVSAPVTGALVDALYTYDVLADDPDAGDTLTLTAPLLPTWLSLVDNGDRSGQLSGTPGAADAGDHPVLLQVSDGIVSVTQEFTITVSDGPVITSANATTFVVGSAGSFSITTAGSPTVTTVSLAGGLPSGVSFLDNGDGTATLSGTPDAGSAADYPVQITAENGVGPDAVQDFTLVVNQAPSIDSANAVTFVAGTPGSFTVLTSGRPTPTLASGGALPAGVSFVDNGDGTATLSGTPAAGTGGGYPLLLTASNSAGSVDQSFTLTIDEAPGFTSADATSFTVGDAGSFDITTFANPAVTSIIAGGDALPGGVGFADNADGTASLTGTPDALTGGEYAITFTASNGIPPDGVQNFSLTVNEAPGITSANNATFAIGSPQSFIFTASGFPDPTFTLGACTPALPASLSLDANSGELSGTPLPGDGGDYACTVTASNGIGSDAGQAFTLSIEAAPQFTSAASTTFTVGTAGSFDITTFANPPVTSIVAGGDALPGGVGFADNADGTASLTGTPDALTGGEYAITFTASNGIPPDAVQNFSLTVNEAPGITSANSATFAIGSPQSFTFTASGFPDPTFTLGACTPALPASLSLDANSGELSGTPLVSDGGTYSCTVTASNGIGSDATQPFVLSIEAAPQFTSADATTFTVGSAGSFNITTSAVPTVTSILRTGDALPGGVGFTDNADGTAALTGTPAALTGGEYAITFTASNGVPPDGVQNFSLTVNEAPGITSANSATFAIGSPQSFIFTASGFPAPDFTLTACTPALPGSLSLNAVSGELSGTPLAGEGGSYACTLTASNGIGSDAVQAFTLAIEEAPSITSGAIAGFAVGSAGSFTATADGFPAPTFTLTACSPALPASLSFDGSSGALTGTPLASQGGSYACTLTATNGVAPNAVQSLTIEISEAPVFTSADNTSFIVGQVSSFNVTTSGFPTSTIGQSGVLPGGIGFLDNGNGTATLSGTPDAGSQTGSPYILDLEASNGVTPNAQQSFSLSVQCPVIALDPAAGNFAINFGSAFSQSFTPSGGTGPYTFALAGALPPGVSLNTGSGLVSGTATDAGVYSFSLQATDAFGCASPSQGYTLSVNLIATADAYNALGNVLVDSSTAPFSVVGNDTLPTGTTISNFDATSSPGSGAVTMTTAAGPSLGQFTYNPPRGRSSGIETFTYTLSRQGVGATGAVTATATVTFTHSGRVWFVNSAGGACAASCDGRQSNPYTSLAAFQTDNNGTGSNPAANDSIFIHSGNYTGPVTLLAGQRLIGQGASSTLASLSGVTVQPGQNLPATSGGAPSLAVAAGGTTVTLGSDNRLHGVHFGNAGAAGTALLGNAFGTLTISENVLITTNGRALNLESGVVAGAGFTSVSSNGSGSEGIRLVGLTAASNLQLGTGAIGAGTGTAFLAQGTLGTVNYAGSISKTTAGRLIDVGAGASGNLTLSGNLSCTGTCGTGAGNHGLRVTGRIGGTLTFSGTTKTFNSSATNPGVSLTSNTGATINFTGGGLAITTTSGTGFNATGGGAVTVQGAGNTIVGTTGTALNVVGTNIGAAGLNFRSISSNGGTNGIVLNNTGTAGGLTVTGVGTTAGSGGTIQNKTDDGVRLENTRNVALNFMNLTSTASVGAPSATCGTDLQGNTGCSAAIDMLTVANITLNGLNISGGQQYGINGNGVAGFTMTGSTISNSGNQVEEDGIRFINLTGTSLIRNTTVQNSHTNNLRIYNTVATPLTLTIDETVAGASRFLNALNNDGILFQGLNNANMTLSISGTDFDSSDGDHIQTAVDDNATMSLIVLNNVMSANADPTVLGSGITLSSSADFNGLKAFNISNNTINGANAKAININLGTSTAAGGTGTYEGVINNNSIGTNGVPQSGGFGIDVLGNGGGTITAQVTGNTVQQFLGDHGIRVLHRDGNGRINATVTSNTVRFPEAGGFNGVSVQGGATSGPPIDSGTICLDFSGNTMAGSGAGGGSATDFRLRQRFNTTFQLRGYAGSAGDTAAVVAYVQGINPGAETGSATVESIAPAGTGFINTPGGAACPLP